MDGVLDLLDHGTLEEVALGKEFGGSFVRSTRSRSAWRRPGVPVGLGEVGARKRGQIGCVSILRWLQRGRGSR